MNKSKCFLITVSILLCILFCGFGIQVNAREGNVVRIACWEQDGSWIQEKNGEWNGYDVQLLDKIASYTGWNYEFIMVEGMEEAVESLDNGQVDMITSVPYIRETAEHFLYSNLSGGYSFGAFIVPKEKDDLSYENLQSFFGCKIGYEDKGGREERYAEVLKNTYQIESLFPYESLDKLRKALETGEIDVMVTSATNMDI